MQGKAAGKTWKEIIEVVGLSEPTCRRIYREENPTRKADTAANIFQMRINGTSWKEIVEATGLSEKTCRKMYREQQDQQNPQD
jgi:DNA-binding Lrp family transcriptional regulator